MVPPATTSKFHIWQPVAWWGAPGVTTPLAAVVPLVLIGALQPNDAVCEIHMGGPSPHSIEKPIQSQNKAHRLTDFSQLRAGGACGIRGLGALGVANLILIKSAAYSSARVDSQQLAMPRASPSFCARNR